MASVNKVIIIGHLGKAPEVRHTANGTAVVDLSVATTRSRKDKDSGTRTEESEWHRLVAYDRLAEIIGEYLTKGSLAYFEGRLQTRQWTDKDGQVRFTTEIIVQEMQMLDSRGAREEGNAAPPARPTAPASARPAAPNAYADAKAGRTKPPVTRPVTAFDDMDDDIPF